MSQKKTIENVISKILIPAFPMITNFGVSGDGIPNDWGRKYSIFLEMGINDYNYHLIENIKKEVKLMLTMIDFPILGFDASYTKNHTYIIRVWVY